jgi:Zn finger protein HypA/HybF involved in hydrogenase expression
MSEWLDRLVPLAGITLSLWVAWVLLKSLFRREEQQKSHLHLVAFCMHCAWEGRVSRQRMQCPRCGSNRLSVVAT